MRRGVRRISMQAYLDDPCPTPSLSSSIAAELLRRTPRHAWRKHKRLNPEHVESTSDRQDFGTAVHSVVLGTDEDRLKVFSEDVKDWRRPDMRQVRDEARAAGNVPLLWHQWSEVDFHAGLAREAILASEVGEQFRRGVSERTLIWQEDGELYCRIRIDRWHRLSKLALDLKVTGGSAAPTVWPFSEQGLFTGDGVIQHAFYRRGLAHVTGIRHRLVFMVYELETGMMTFLEPDLEAQDQADSDVAEAIAIFRDCLATGEWPGYSPKIMAVGAPGGHAMRRETAALIRPRPSAEALTAARQMQSPAGRKSRSARKARP